jgi:DNA polymerase V
VRKARPTPKALAVTGIFSFEARSRQLIPLFLARVQAGFPSPSEDYLEGKLDLNEFLIRHPAATFFVRVEGQSMVNAGINSGDILIVDRAMEARDQKIVVAVLNGEFTVKRIKRKKDTLYLIPESQDYKPMAITPDMNFQVWGVVTYVIHPV